MPGNRRLTKRRLRTALYIAADGKCCMCGAELGKSWHADHIIPWCVTKDTNVHDMQALCRECNLKKGKKMSVSELSMKRAKERVNAKRELRAHQRDAVAIASRMGKSPIKNDCVFWIVPGGGKSWLPPLMLEHLPGWKIAWFVPRLALRHQAEYGTLEDFGIQIRASANETDPSRGSRGFVSTHQSLESQPDLWRHELSRGKYLLVIDEVHHAKITRQGVMNQLAAAIDKLPYTGRVLMTGTLDTNDSTLIYGVNYLANDGNLIPHLESSGTQQIRYSRSTALSEGAIVPVSFFSHDGPVRWKDIKSDEEDECTLSCADKDQESNALFTALRTDVARQILERAVNHCKQYGEKLLVVCHSQEAATVYARDLSSVFQTFLAITENEDAHGDIWKFKRSKNGCLVTCAMAYEGLDDKDISHIACLTHIRSVPWIEQMIARAWRAKPGKTECFCFVPDDPKMRRVIEKIRQEDPSIIKEQGTCGPGGGGGNDELIMGVEGRVVDVRCISLDGHTTTLTEPQSELMELATKLGIDPKDERLLSLLNDIASTPPVFTASQPLLTIREKEKSLKNAIADLCRKFDSQMSPPNWGYHQAKLIRMTGKSITIMHEDELEDAYRIASRFTS